MSKFLPHLLEEDGDLSSDNETERFVNEEYFTPPRFPHVSTQCAFQNCLKLDFHNNKKIKKKSDFWYKVSEASAFFQVWNFEIMPLSCSHAHISVFFCFFNILFFSEFYTK